MLNPPFAHQIILLWLNHRLFSLTLLILQSQNFNHKSEMRLPQGKICSNFTFKMELHYHQARPEVSTLKRPVHFHFARGTSIAKSLRLWETFEGAPRPRPGLRSTCANRSQQLLAKTFVIICDRLERLLAHFVGWQYDTALYAVRFYYSYWKTQDRWTSPVVSLLAWNLNYWPQACGPESNSSPVCSAKILKSLSPQMLTWNSLFERGEIVQNVPALL